MRRRYITRRRVRGFGDDAIDFLTQGTVTTDASGNAVAVPGSTYTQAPPKPAGPTLFQTLLGALVAPKPPQYPIMAPPSSGISTTTLVIGGAAALTIIAIIAARK